MGRVGFVFLGSGSSGACNTVALSEGGALFFLVECPLICDKTLCRSFLCGSW